MSNQPPAALPLVGATLAGKYRVERILGQGGMGVVVEARHLVLEDRVALKFLLPEYAAHPDASARFVREAQVAAKIKSEHVARVTDVGTLDTGAGYMVMEYLEGCDLRGLLEKQGVLQVPEAIDYILQACEALAEAHGYGIVHRDLKPANLFLTKRPNGLPLVKVLDFGISKVTSGTVDHLTRTTTAMGSALYMSPEQMQQAKGVDHRTDIYALGVSLYELLAGKQPFVADTLPALCAEIFTGTPTPIRSIRTDVAEGLAAVLERAYARDRGVRYQSIGELAVALAPWAPPQSQSILESVARIAGLPAPTAGAPVSLSDGAPSPQMGLRVSSSALGVSTDSSGRVSSPVMGGLPANTGPGVAVGSEPAKPMSKGVLVAIALGVMVVVGGGTFLGLRGTKPSPSAVAPSSGGPPTPPAAPGTATAAAAPATPAPPSAQAAPAPAPSAPPAAEPAPVQPTAAAPVAEKAPPAGALPKARPAHQAAPTKAPAKPGQPVDVVGF